MSRCHLQLTAEIPTSGQRWGCSFSGKLLCGQLLQACTAQLSSTAKPEWTQCHGIVEGSRHAVSCGVLIDRAWCRACVQGWQMGSLGVVSFNTAESCIGCRAQHHILSSSCGPACRMTSARRLPPAWLGEQQLLAAFQACPTRGTATRGLTGAFALAGRPAARSDCCGWVPGWQQRLTPAEGSAASRTATMTSLFS